MILPRLALLTLLLGSLGKVTAAQCVGTEDLILTMCDSNGISAGSCMAIEGDTLVVGVPNDDEAFTRAGAAWVFERISGSWVCDTKLLSPGAEAYGRFGSSVSMDGDRILVGAPEEDLPSGNGNAGRAYVFRRTALGWVHDGTLLSPSPTPNEEFGRAVAIEGGVAVVGAPQSDPIAGVNAGSAYVHHRRFGVWSHSQTLDGGQTPGDRFGTCVDLQGSVIAVGSPDDSPTSSRSGSVTIFGEAGSVWIKEQVLDPGTASRARFGTSLDLDELRLIVGGPDADSYFASMGDAHIFESDPSQIPGFRWSLTARLVPGNGHSHDDFGMAVHLDGDVAVVGAPESDTASSNAGSVYQYRFAGSQWLEERNLIASNGLVNDDFGASVLVQGEQALVGAPGNDALYSSAGSVYQYDGLDGLILSSNQSVYSRGDPFELDASCGQPGDLCLVAVVEFDRAPIFRIVPALTAVFAPDHHYRFSATVGDWTPPPFELGLQAFRLHQVGGVTASNRLSLQFR